MKIPAALFAALIIPFSLSQAEVQLELDGQTVTEIESIVYDSGSKRIRIVLSGDRPCFGFVVPPPAGQIGLTLGLNDHALAVGPIYSARSRDPVLVLDSQLGGLSCTGVFLFQDRFEESG